MPFIYSSDGQSKPFWQSKTVIFNAVFLIVAIVGAIMDAHIFTDERVLTGLGLVVTIGNIVLRFITTQPLSMTRQDTGVHVQGDEPYRGDR